MGGDASPCLSVRRTRRDFRGSSIDREIHNARERRRWVRRWRAMRMPDTQSRESTSRLSMPVRDGGEPLGNFLTTAAGRATWEQFASPWRFVTFLSSTVNGYSGRVFVRARAAAPVSRDDGDAARGIPEFVVEFRSSFENARSSLSSREPRATRAGDR